MEKHALSIWLFVGVILLIYGGLILGAGIYDYYHPLSHPVVLSRLHAGIWWGLLLIGLGSLYCYKFFPRKKKH